MDAAATLREAILEKLHAHEWRPGHRLPAERELGAQFGLGRSTVRRVLQGFKAQGLVTQAVGSGTFVADGAALLLAEARAGAAGTAGGAARATSPAELMAARLVFEPAWIELVTANAHAVDFARFDECLVRSEAASSAKTFEHWDARLHEAIADAAHNAFVSGVVRLVGEVRVQGAWGSLKKRSASPERRAQYEREHRALVAALKDRDTVRAQALCTAHLLQVRIHLFGS
jgi:DNA-binding FadR family transcriptional regulator